MAWRKAVENPSTAPSGILWPGKRAWAHPISFTTSREKAFAKLKMTMWKESTMFSASPYNDVKTKSSAKSDKKW